MRKVLAFTGMLLCIAAAVNARVFPDFTSLIRGGGSGTHSVTPDAGLAFPSPSAVSRATNNEWEIISTWRGMHVRRSLSDTVSTGTLLKTTPAIQVLYPGNFAIFDSDSTTLAVLADTLYQAYYGIQAFPYSTYLAAECLTESPRTKTLACIQPFSPREDYFDSVTFSTKIIFDDNGDSQYILFVISDGNGPLFSSGWISVTSAANNRWVYHSYPLPAPLNPSEIYRAAIYTKAKYGRTCRISPIVFKTRTPLNIILDGDDFMHEAAPAIADSSNRIPDTVVNLALFGQTTATLCADTTIQVDPLVSSHYEKNICVVWCGSNDRAELWNNTVTRLTAYIRGRQAAGYTVVALGMLPRGDLTPAEQTAWGTFDLTGVADVFIDPAEGALADYNDSTYYQPDKVHLTTAGNAVIAGLVRAAIAGL